MGREGCEGIDVRRDSMKGGGGREGNHVRRVCRMRG